MIFSPVIPPRVFKVGRGDLIEMKDCGRVHLRSDEQVTFLTEAGGEYDVARTTWGFYATPSMNRRLSGFGLRAALVRSIDKKLFLMLIERGKEPEFQQYLVEEGQEVLHWLDTDSEVEALRVKLKS